MQKTNFFEFFTLTIIRTGKCLRGHEITTLNNLPVKIFFFFFIQNCRGDVDKYRKSFS